MKKPNASLWIKDLNRILKKGIISPLLRMAVQESIKALKAKDYDLAFQITACKSFTTSKIYPKDKKYAFQEDCETNEKILGNSVYSILDGITHHIAYSIGSIPSGMMIISSDGSTEEFQRKGKHPIIARMEYEHNQIVKEFNRPTNLHQK
jgi:homoaconitase/3-isopropylmalate dehydratase large subunit